MSTKNEGQCSKRLGMTRWKGKRIKGRKVLNHHISEITPKKVSKARKPKMIKRMHIHLGKGQGNNLFNVGDVRGITYIGTSLIKEKEWGLSTTFKRPKIVGDMEGNMERIYAFLDNKQIEYQSPMIEVEWSGDQILLKNSKCLELLQIKREHRPRHYEPNATCLGSNRHREREISRSVQNGK